MGLRLMASLVVGLIFFTAIILGYGLYLLFGNLVIFAICAAVLAGVSVYLLDVITTEKPE